MCVCIPYLCAVRRKCLFFLSRQLANHTLQSTNPISTSTCSSSYPSTFIKVVSSRMIKRDIGGALPYYCEYFIYSSYRDMDMRTIWGKIDILELEESLLTYSFPTSDVFPRFSVRKNTNEIDNFFLSVWINHGNFSISVWEKYSWTHTFLLRINCNRNYNSRNW